mgnify:CR=1 FL=1
MKLLEEKGLEVIGAVYHLEDGHVEIFWSEEWMNVTLSD